jgi:hypothetical protein
MDNSFGITCFLFLVIWLVPICAREFRNSAQLMLAYWFLIAIHQAVAFTNAFLFTTISGSGDATGFHNKAITFVQSEHFAFYLYGGHFYANMLGIVYWIFGTSKILGQQLSILAFSISCVVLVKILCQLELSRYKVPVLLAFGALPTMVFLGSLTSREPHEIMFFMLASYFGLKMYIARGINKYLLFMIMSAVGMAVFHQALYVYACFLIMLFLLWPHGPVYVWSVRKLRVVAAFAVPVLILVSANYLAGNSPLSVFGNSPLSFFNDIATSLWGDKDVLERAAWYRDAATVSRASYGIALDLSSSFATIYSSLQIYIYYLFAPFPWQVSNIPDLYAALESFLRLVLIYFALKNWRNAYGEQRRLIGLMLILFFSMAFLWALGTTNYGQAIRHHMLSWWIIVILGVPPLLENRWVNRFLKK